MKKDYYPSEYLSDLTIQTIPDLVTEEYGLRFDDFTDSGVPTFRGKSYDEWYELAYEAFESWHNGEEWGKKFELIAETLELMENGGK